MKPEIRRILLASAIPLFLIFVIYTSRILETGMGWDFTTWGIYPREAKGIPGIFTSSLIHAGFNHLFANTLPLLFLTWCLFYFYRDLGIGILLFVWILGGTLTFIIGKPGWHIGASGLVYSLAFFLFFSGVLRKYIPMVALSLLITFLYGSLIWNMFPQFAAASTSWEGHLGGAVAGVAAAVLFRHKGPQQPEPFADEEEDEEEENEKEETPH
ncbi:rhomboid family intramembrane serine protease [Phocaeicola sp.]